jgi:hypothetical protein
MLDVEVRAELLKTVMLEDRQEIRLLKGRIYELCSILTGLSFGVSSFLIGRGQPTRNRWLFFLLTDLSFLALLWVSFLRLKRDLDIARQCLEAREDMIRDLGTPQEGPFNPFPNVGWADRPKISENGLYWLAWLATLTIAVKMLVMVVGVVA